MQSEDYSIEEEKDSKKLILHSTNTYDDQNIVSENVIVDNAKSPELIKDTPNSMQENDHLGATAETFIEDCSELMPIQKKSRKRKHNKKKKALNDDKDKDYTHKRKREDNYSDVKYKEQNTTFKRSHIIFSESDDDDCSSVSRSKDENDNSNKSLNKHSTPLLHNGFIYDSTPKVLSDLDKDVERNLISPIQYSLKPNKNQQLSDIHSHDSKPSFSRCPPQPRTIEEPSSEVYSQFKKLIALEENMGLTPKIFVREEYDPRKNDENEEAWNSLPLSFASRKDLNQNRNSPYSMHNHFTSSLKISRQNVSDNSNSKKHSQKSSPALQVEEQFLVDATQSEDMQEPHVGAKASRKPRAKYFQSVGNILNMLKTPESKEPLEKAQVKKSHSPPNNSYSLPISSNVTNTCKEDSESVKSCYANFVQSDVSNGDCKHFSDKEKPDTELDTQLYDRIDDLERQKDDLVPPEREDCSSYLVEKDLEKTPEKVASSREKRTDSEDSTIPVLDLEDELVSYFYFF